jgi:hypothetical protein
MIAMPKAFPVEFGNDVVAGARKRAIARSDAVHLPPTLVGAWGATPDRS